MTSKADSPPLSRIGVLGDVHAEDARLDEALALFESLEVDAVWCVGDVVDGPGDADRCVALLRDAGVISVRGNHDRWFLTGAMRSLPEITESLQPENRRWLEHLPATYETVTPLGRTLLCHGLGPDDMARFSPDDYGYAIESNSSLQALTRTDLRLVIAGHTHRPMVRRMGSLTIVNAGTLHRDHDPGFVVLDLNAVGAEDVSEWERPPRGAVGFYRFAAEAAEASTEWVPLL